jgi:ABC-2 type transport system ATP-binding protein
MDEAIKTESLTKVFEKSQKKRLTFHRSKQQSQKILALDHLDLTIPKNTLFGLLGPNGAGKTTTIKLLSTLLLPEEGTAHVNGFDITKQANDVRRSIGVVTGGERGLYWRLTGRENLLFYARLYGIRDNRARPRIEELLKLAELGDRADDNVEKYSRGMKQRLHIIRGLIHDPPILLLDEPTLGLDPNSAVVMRDFIKEKLQKEFGKTILLTTHYMEEADQLCDRISIIDHGRIIADGTSDALKSKVRKTDVLRINAANVSGTVQSQIDLIEGVQNVTIRMIDPIVGLSEILVHTTNAEETLPHLTEMMVKLGIRIRLIEQSKPSLEDVFISVTGRRLRD